MNDRPNNSPTKLSYRLALIMPLALLVFVVAATWWSFHLGRRQASESVRNEATRDLTWTASRLESTFEGAIRLGDNETIQEAVAALGANRGFTFAVLTDEHDAVLHSMRLADIGKPLQQVLPASYKDAALLRPDRLNVIRQRKGGAVESTGDGRTVIAAYPLVLGTRPGELRPNRIGNLVLVSDYSSRKVVALQLVTRQALSFVTLTSLLAVGMGLFFHLAVTRRLNRLARVAEDFGAGRTHVQSGIRGGDEVAQLAHSFDRMMAEKAAADVQIKESEERYRGLFESTHDMVQSVSTEGRFIFVNPEWKRTLGYSDNDLNQMTVFDVIHPDSIEHCQALFEKVMSGESVPQLEATFVAKDGRSVVVEGNASPRLDAGRIVATHGFFRDITQRKEEQAVFLERKFRLRAILATAVEGIITIDSCGTIETANPAAEVLFGYTASELTGQNVKMLMPSPYHEEHDGYLAHYRETGEKKIIGIGRNVVGRRKDGTTFPMELAVSEVTIGDKTIFTGFVRDLTERQRSEEIEQSLGRILDHSLNEIYIFDATTLKFIQVNRGACENLGYTIEELQQMTPLDLEPAYTAERFDQLAQPLRTGEAEKLTFYGNHRRKDRTNYDVEVHLQIGRFQGKPCFVAIALDITERKERESELRVRTHAVESAASGILITDPTQDDNPIIYVNRAMEEMTGYSAEEVIGRNCRFLHNNDGDQEGLQPLRAAIKAESECKVVLRNYRKDGSLFWNELTVSPVRDDDGKLTHFVGIQSDITDRREAEETLDLLNEQLEQRVERRTRQLQEAQEQLVRKEKLATLGQLAGTVAHEIRNPLGIIKNAVYFLEGTNSGDDKDVSESFGEINRALFSSNRIVGELLDFARDPKLEVTEFPAIDVIDRALSLVQLPEDVIVERESDASNARLRADAGKVERILINLIQNAAQAMADGGSLIIRCRRSTGEQTQIEVEDTGHGIHQDELEKVLRRYIVAESKVLGSGWRCAGDMLNSIKAR